MGADNWRRCPKCLKVENSKREAEIERVSNQYGKIPVAEFTRAAAAAEKPIVLGETLREDYELGINDNGEYEVSFSASCQKCGFKFNHSHSEMSIF
jgi:ribosome-binding protein aMBF1 (putative translation factor)